MKPKPGEVVLVWDREVHPPKYKRLICIDPSKQYFLRINSKPTYRPHHPLEAVDADFLDHDSYVELRQLVRPFAYEIAEAEHLGNLSLQQAMSLMESVEQAETLSQEHKDLIIERLTPS